MIQLAWRFLDYQKESALAKMVPSSYRKRQWLAQENDRGLGAQASHRLVALRPRWHRA
jgi:hypothetical protein